MSIKTFLKTPKGQLTAAFSALAVSWLFLLFYFAGPIDGLIPSAQLLAEKENELKKLRKEKENLMQRFKVVQANEKAYEKMQQGFWQPGNGVVETDLRTLIQEAAKKAELTLNNLGAVKTSKINETLYYAELDVQGTAPIETIAAFLSRVREISPILSWKRFETRFDMRALRNADTAVSNDLTFSGTLRVIVNDNQEAVK